MRLIHPADPLEEVRALRVREGGREGRKQGGKEAWGVGKLAGRGKLVSHGSGDDGAGMGGTAVQAAGLLGISGVCFTSAGGCRLLGTAPRPPNSVIVQRTHGAEPAPNPTLVWVQAHARAHTPLPGHSQESPAALHSAAHSVNK